MAAIPLISETQRVTQFVPGQGKNQYVRASDYNALANRVNSLLSSDATVTAVISYTGANTHTGAETHTGVETHTGAETHSGAETFASLTEFTSGAGIAIKSATTQRNTLSALNADGTLTAAMLATGGITSTSAAAVAATIDSIANIATQFGALTPGFVIPFWVLNGGSNTVTIALPAGMVVNKQVSSGDSAVNALLTVAASATIGVAKFEIVMLTATAAVINRVY